MTYDPKNEYGTPEYFAERKKVLAPDAVWQVKNDYEVKYYQSERALLAYFGSWEEAEKEHIITKYVRV